MRTVSPRLGLVVVLAMAVFALVPRLPAAEEPEACGAGYWKNHLEAWKATVPAPHYQLDHYSPNDHASDIPFHLVTLGDVPTPRTLLSILSYKGGPGLEGASRLLLREAVVALLNAAHPDINYECFDGPGNVHALVNHAVIMVDYPDDEARRQAYLDLAARFAACNDGVCPL